MPDLSEIWSSRRIGRPRKRLPQIAEGFGPTGEEEYLGPGLVRASTSAPLKGRERSIGQPLCDIRHPSKWLHRFHLVPLGQVVHGPKHTTGSPTACASPRTARPLGGHGKKNASAPATMRKTCSSRSHPSHSTRSSTPNHRAR
jgi:hypothetical protein